MPQGRRTPVEEATHPGIHDRDPAFRTGRKGYASPCWQIHCLVSRRGRVLGSFSTRLAEVWALETPANRRGRDLPSPSSAVFAKT